MTHIDFDEKDGLREWWRLSREDSILFRFGTLENVLRIARTSYSRYSIRSAVESDRHELATYDIDHFRYRVGRYKNTGYVFEPIDDPK